VYSRLVNLAENTSTLPMPQEWAQIRSQHACLRKRDVDSHQPQLETLGVLTSFMAWFMLSCSTTKSAIRTGRSMSTSSDPAVDSSEMQRHENAIKNSNKTHFCLGQNSVTFFIGRKLATSSMVCLCGQIQLIHKAARDIFWAVPGGPQPIRHTPGDGLYRKGPMSSALPNSSYSKPCDHALTLKDEYATPNERR
jgi:hypothetical protein